MRSAILALTMFLGGCAVAAGPAAEGGPFVPPGDPWGVPGSPARGAVLAQTRCSGCHATGSNDRSPMLAAPPFRTLSQRYPVANLQEALAEGLVTAHPAMPEITLEEHDVADLIAYLDSVGNSDLRDRR